MTARDLPRNLTVTEVADLLGVESRTVRRWCAAGKLPAVRVGERWRVRTHVLRDRYPEILFERLHGDR